MTGATDEIWLGLEQTDDLPHGRGRIARLEELLALAEDLGTIDRSSSDLIAELDTAIRVSLIPACLYGGEHQRVPGLLATLLERYDESPAWFGPEQQHIVLFSFSLAAVGLVQHPDVPLPVLERLLATMAERYQAAGESMAPVLRAQFLLTLHVSGPERTKAEFEAWVAAGRSELSECELCERTEQVRELAALGRHQEALAAAMPVLDGQVPIECDAQPAAMIAAVLGSLLEAGSPGSAERAASEHIRAVRLIRDGVHSADPGRADHLLICARTGRLQRGLELLEGWLPWYARVEPPSIQLQTAAAAGRVLRGLAEVGHGHLVLTADGDGAEPTTVDELGARLAREARDLGARFDARNGTSTIGDLVEQVLDAPSLPDLPLDALTRSPRGARVGRPPSRNRKGRRAAGRSSADLPQSLPLHDLPALAETFDLALKADLRARCGVVLEAWRELRASESLEAAHLSGPDAQAAARLDGWLAIEGLIQPGLDGPAEQQGPLATAALATERLRAAGLPVEALLHEQAFLLTAAQAGRVDLGAARQRIEQLAIEICESAGPGDAGLALSRLVLIREVAAAAGHGAAADLGGGSAEPPSDSLDAGLASLSTVPRAQLGHQQLRAVCRLLRLRAADEPPQVRIRTLTSAVGVLPDGIRPLERALAGADLAGVLAESDPAAALAAWEQAIADASSADAAPLLGNLLAASATLRHTLGDPGRAAEDLMLAVPLLDEHAAAPLAAQARFDLSRALLDLGRSFEAAEVAEAGLADLTDLLNTQSVAPELPPASPAEMHLAGCSAFAAAEANATIGATVRAREFVELSAQWHARNGNLIAQAEAWQLAARLGGPAAQVADDLQRAAELSDAGGDWNRAATCRRERVIAIKDAEGLDAALAALTEAKATLVARTEALNRLRDGEQMSDDDLQDAQLQLRWHRLAVAEERARLLALNGRFAEAMTEVIGLEDEYSELGDDWSARDLKGLRGQLRAELDDLDGALDDLRLAAEDALAAGDPAQARGLGERLAAVLGGAGRTSEAEAAWQRYCSELSPA